MVGVLALIAVTTLPITDPGPWGDFDAAPSGDPDAAVVLPDTRDGLADAAADPRSTGERRSPDAESPTCVADGCIEWVLLLPDRLEAAPRVVVDDGRIIVSHIDASTAPPPLEDDGEHLGPGPAGLLTVVDAETGRLRWQRTIGLPALDLSPARVVAVDDQLLAVDRIGRVSSFDLTDGTPRFELAVAGATAMRGAEMVGDELLVTVAATPTPGHREERVLALDPESGAQRWPSVAAEQVVLTTVGPVLFERGGSMWALDTSDGSERWRGTAEQAFDPVGLGEYAVFGRARTTIVHAGDGTVLDTLPSRSDVASWRGPRPLDDQGLLLLDPSTVSHLAPDGSTWTNEVIGCCAGAGVDAATIALLLEDGAVRWFSRADGSERSVPRRQVSRDGRDQLVGLAGGYLVVFVDRDGGNELELEDAVTGERLARLGGSFPVGLTPEGGLLLHQPGRLIALEPPTVVRGGEASVP